MISHFNATAQDYAYTFQGKLSETEAERMISTLEELHYFQEIKIRLKESGGELFFSIPPKTGGKEQQEPYSLVTIKSLLIQFGVQPVSFKERNH